MSTESDVPRMIADMQDDEESMLVGPSKAPPETMPTTQKDDPSCFDVCLCVICLMVLVMVMVAIVIKAESDKAEQN